MKLLLVGFDAPWINTGFASTLRSIGQELLCRGHEVFSICGNFVFETDGPINHNGIIVLSNKGCNLYPDKEMFLRYYDQIKPDFVIAHQDFYRIRYLAELGNDILDKTLVWLPIENTDRLIELDSMRKIKNIAFTTDYGVRLYKDLLIRSRIFQINHQVSSEFCAKADINFIAKYPQLNNKFVILRVDRNQPRKRWDLTLKTFAAFIKKYYITDCILIAKTRPRDIVSNIDLELLAKDLGILQNVLFVEDDLTTPQMRSLYDVSSVFMTTTGSEGFGLSIAEAMVAGKPILCPKYEPLISVVGPGCGVFVDVKEKEYDQSMHVHYNTIDTDKACEELYNYYKDWKLGGARIRQEGRRAVINSRKYDVKLVVDDFEKTFDEMKKKHRTVLVSIATKNRPDHLVALLTSLQCQTYKDFDVFIFDNSDNEDIISKSAFTKQLELFHKSGHEACIWKNSEPQNAPDTHQKIFEIAVKNKYEYVLKIDDDCILSSDVLEKLMKTITSDENVAVATCSILDVGSLENKTLPVNFEKQDLNIIWSGKNRQWYFCTDMVEEEIEHAYSSFIYRVEALKEIGGFPKDLSKVAFREETLTTYPMFLNGWKLINNQNAIMWHMKASYGGCRDSNIEELYRKDDEEFKKRLMKLKEDHDA